MKVFLQTPNRPKTRRLIGVVDETLIHDWRNVALQMGIPRARLVGGRRLKRSGSEQVVLLVAF
jgi:anthranilate phosphoribosyltransferase